MSDLVDVLRWGTLEQWLDNQMVDMEQIIQEKGDLAKSPYEGALSAFKATREMMLVLDGRSDLVKVEASIDD